MTPSRVDREAARLTVPANIGLRAGCLMMVLLSAAATLGLAPQIYPATDRAPAAVAMTLVAVVPILLGTSAIRVRGDRLQVVNALLISEVALADVAYLDHRNGFEVVLRSGYRVDYVGSAPSLIGSITRYWSARRMIDTIDAALDHPFPGPTGWQPGDHPISRRLRTTAIVGCAAYMVTGTVAALSLGSLL